MAVIGALDIVSSVNTAGFTRGISKMKKGANSLLKPLAVLGAALGAGAIVAGLKSLHDEAANNIDSMAKFSDEIGVSTEELAGYRLGAELTGTSIQSLDKGLQIFVRRLGEAKAGFGEGVRGFDALGLSAEKLADMDTASGFKEVAEKISNLSTPAEKAAASYKLFGRQGQELLTFFDSGKQGIDGFVTEADRLGLSFSRLDAQKVEQANDAMTKMGTVFTSIGQELAIGLAPIITALADQVTEFRVSGFSATETVLQGISLLGKGIAITADVVHTLHLGFKYLQSGITKYISLALIPLDYLYQGVTKLLNLLGADVDTTFFSSMRTELDNLAKDQFDAANNALLLDPPSVKIDAFFDKLDKGARAVADSLSKPKEEIDAMAEAMFEATIKADNLIKKLESEKGFLQSGESDKEIFDLMSSGVDRALIDRARNLQDEIAQINEAKDKEADAKSAAERIREELRSPLEVFRQEAEKIADNAFLSSEEKARAIAQLQKDSFAEPEEKAEPQLFKTFAGALDIASNDIRRMRLGVGEQEPNKKALKESEKQTKLQEQLLIEYRKSQQIANDLVVSI